MRCGVSVGVCQYVNVSMDVGCECELWWFVSVGCVFVNVCLWWRHSLRDLQTYH